VELEKKLLLLEEEESRKDKEWVLKKREIKAFINNLCTEYMELENEIRVKIQELSPLV
jgi:hypothetical protein